MNGEKKKRAETMEKNSKWQQQKQRYNHTNLTWQWISFGLTIAECLSAPFQFVCGREKFLEESNDRNIYAIKCEIKTTFFFFCFAFASLIESKCKRKFIATYLGRRHRRCRHTPVQPSFFTFSKEVRCLLHP